MLDVESSVRRGSTAFLLRNGFTTETSDARCLLSLLREGNEELEMRKNRRLNDGGCTNS